MDTYDRAFLVHADNVGSKQFMDIRAVRGSHRGRQIARRAGAWALPLPPPCAAAAAAARR